jgi:epoxyqueuosine reductase
MRARWDGMRRNACIVLGNRGGREAIPALRAAAAGADPVVGEHARWAIARIENRKPDSSL